MEVGACRDKGTEDWMVLTQDATVNQLEQGGTLGRQLMNEVDMETHICYGSCVLLTSRSYLGQAF